MTGSDFIYDEPEDFYKGFGTSSAVNGAPEETPSRRLLVVLLDVSASMGQSPGRREKAPIIELNERFRALFASGELTKMLNTEIAIGAFFTVGQGAQVERKVVFLPLGTPVRPGSNVYWAAHAKWEREESLQAQGNTPVAFAISTALGVIQERLTQWSGRNTERDCRPVLVVLTDGELRGADDVTTAAAEVHAMEAANDLAFWIAGMGQATEESYISLANKGNFVPLRGKAIEAFIRLMSMSLQAAQAAEHDPVESLYARVTAKFKQLESDSVAGA